MAISGGALFEPMATVMIGGLAVASPLSLLVVPSLYYLLLKGKGLSVDEAQPSDRLYT